MQTRQIKSLWGFSLRFLSFLWMEMTGWVFVCVVSVHIMALCILVLVCEFVPKEKKKIIL